MPRVSIDYMNARRDSKAASGGKVYRLDTNAVDLRDAWNAMTECEQILAELDFAIDDFRRKRVQIVADTEMLLRGENYEDLSF